MNEWKNKEGGGERNRGVKQQTPLWINKVYGSFFIAADFRQMASQRKASSIYKYILKCWKKKSILQGAGTRCLYFSESLYSRTGSRAWWYSTTLGNWRPGWVPQFPLRHTCVQLCWGKTVFVHNFPFVDMELQWGNLGQIEIFSSMHQNNGL